MEQDSFPLKVVEGIAKKYLDRKYDSQEKKKKNENVRYYKLPFLGHISINTQNKINQAVKHFCKEGTALKLAFSTCKVASFFSPKDKIADVFKSHVVYKFSCAGCSTCYIGETSRYYSTRVYEHLHTDKTSQVYKHVHGNIECKGKNDISSFSILDTASTKYGLELKEGLYINWEQPSLNKQVKCKRSTIVV